MKYVSLHTHTTFSPLDGFGTPKQFVERALEINAPALAITEHGNVSSHVQLERACKDTPVKPIYGCEFYIVDTVENNTRSKNHITVLAKNLEGYHNLLKLGTLAYKEDHFYYMPTISKQDLFDYKDNLIVLSGCQRGLLSQKIIKEETDNLEGLAQELNDNLDHFYLEIQPLELPDSISVNIELIELSKKTGIPLVATNDVHYLRKGQEKEQWFLSSVRRRKNVYDEWGTMSPRCYLATRQEMLDWGAPEEAVNNTVRIAEMCERYELPKAKKVKYGVDNAEEMLLDWCRKGWFERGINKKSNWEEYRSRVLREFELIKSKEYVDYFLVVADMVKWAKEQGILVGPARGSAAGSLVSYLIGITEVDPIRWDLLFERFIDVSRLDPPDIDLDFQDNRRQEVKDYLVSKYGEERVTNIAGYSTFQDKGLLDDIGRVFKVPRNKVSEIKDELRENGGDKNIEEVIQEHFENHEYLVNVLGQIRQMTTHAAGVVVASKPIRNFTILGRDGIMLDYRDAEKLGLMKIDVLSLTTLTMIDYCLKAIGKDLKWLYNLPLDDEETYKAFSGDYFKGVFQYEGATTKRVCKQIGPTTIEELIDINALSRPGPMQSGATEAYIRGWREEVHPIVTKHTERSRGQILFQEQIMKILREVGKLSWGDVTKVRKLITKKADAEVLVGIRERFMEEFKDDPALGAKIWKMCGESGAYGFNISHSTSYAMLGYYCMYLKTHYPLEFYWANLMLDPDDESLLREFAVRGGKVYGVKVGKSKANWSIDNGGLRAGYLTVKGIGPVTAEKLIEGWKPTSSIKKKLEQAGAYKEELNDDYLGVNKLGEELSDINGRNKIGEIEPGDFVRIAGVVTEIKYKNLREYYLSQGRDYESEVKEPDKDRYIHLKLADETGEKNVTINRWKCADENLWDSMVNRGEKDLLLVQGEYNEKYDKIFAVRIKNIPRR